ncbi:DUF6093 family protein [Actinomadura luteofluorescens]|uniref:DUF6093 family protein n=1 Tax=Actinomadura luteofluorescens TaxID=46163 RepID=UPI003D8A4D86
MPLGSPAAGPIHPRWSEHHRPTATGLMTAACTISGAGGDGSTDANGDWTPGTGDPIYDGPCRLQALTTNERVEVAGETQTTVRRYLIAIEHDAARVEVGATVTITAAVDAEAVGMTLRVVDVRYGSEQWERDLIAEETDREGEGA